MKNLDFEDFDNEMLAIRLRYEMNLCHAIESEWQRDSQLNKTYPKSYARLKRKIFLRNFRRGIRIIENKNPLYIEMPKLESVGNGYIKKVSDNSDNSGDEEIEVHGAIEQTDRNQIEF